MGAGSLQTTSYSYTHVLGHSSTGGLRLRARRESSLAAMAKGPAVVVIARHGARLDAADKTWHLTSPTPYDPPLTYGGWSQGKALGLRIAALLHQRDTQRPTKKRKIVIHSSPYLRCVQTSAAVAAGIAQFKRPASPRPTAPSPATGHDAVPADAAAPAKPPPASTYTLPPSTLGPLADPKPNTRAATPPGPDKILLRIDAFLGEWLSPDYYEHITPPPPSPLMVAGAKADLLRRGDAMLEMSHAQASKGFFPGGWVGPGAAVAARPAVRSLASASAFRERASSQGSAPLQRTRSTENVASLAPPVRQSAPSRNYEPPTPSYSVSPADPIPRGYFAHAREACLHVDFQWDSMRPPQEWGDGGEYGDEWSTMHKRFRRGLASMMEWYREHGAAPPKHQVAGFMFREPLRLTPVPAAKKPTEPFPSFDGGIDTGDDEELVLILLTHGAGCNALLGAIANQPVLVDIGLASLSMAVRRDVPRAPTDPTIHERRPSVVDPGMAETYDIKLMASVDHLKPSSDPSKLPTQSQANPPIVMPSPSLESRRRFAASPGAKSPIDSPFSIGDPFKNWGSSLGSARRTMSSGSSKLYTQSNLNPGGAAASVGGLWSSPKLAPAAGPGISDGISNPAAELLLNFSVQQPQPKPSATGTSSTNGGNIPALDGASDITNGLMKLNTNEETEISDSIAPLTKAHHRTSNTSSGVLWGAKAPPKNNVGLWGPPRLDDVYEHGRGPKRRWTMTEREE
ncbi:hypothetical protein BDU57DRAFT_552358 [Ampelomyces quisqualis]|uniref:Histidine phosphatase superfamily n=1 Tax=Ampelomyces quisqualis TaxID=50730 RepID=A0A6A5Q6H6_AMPQU|nr:hypothetical protein BDU57DRAFT_552358 [Ampelomyces quisqualis]